jgi:hypothetical protein
MRYAKAPLDLTFLRVFKWDATAVNHACKLAFSGGLTEARCGGEEGPQLRVRDRCHNGALRNSICVFLPLSRSKSRKRIGQNSPLARNRSKNDFDAMRIFIFMSKRISRACVCKTSTLRFRVTGTHQCLSTLEGQTENIFPYRQTSGERGN